MLPQSLFKRDHLRSRPGSRVKVAVVLNLQKIIVRCANIAGHEAELKLRPVTDRRVLILTPDGEQIVLDRSQTATLHAALGSILNAREGH